MQCPAVAVLGTLVGPGHRAVAVVCEALVGLHAQQTQEAQLDHAYWLAIGVYVGELCGERATVLRRKVKKKNKGVTHRLGGNAHESIEVKTQKEVIK